MAEREQARTADAPAAGAATETPRGLDLMRLSLAGADAPTRKSVLRDLEAAKHLAFDRGNAATVARAAEMQGRIVGAFREPDPNAIRLATDEELVAILAAGNETVAEILRDLLAKGQWRPPPQQLPRRP